MKLRSPINLKRINNIFKNVKKSQFYFYFQIHKTVQVKKLNLIECQQNLLKCHLLQALQRKLQQINFPHKKSLF